MSEPQLIERHGSAFSSHHDVRSRNRLIHVRLVTDAPGREDEDDFLYGAPTVSPGTSNTPAPVSETPAGPIEGKTYRIAWL